MTTPALPTAQERLANTLDPTKHLLGYGRRDTVTGMLHGHIRWPNGTAPTPLGCRWCGGAQGSHGRQWMAGRGMHSWARPTEAQIKARMLARRAARLVSEPARYHAHTDWTGTVGDPEDPGDEMCADCRSTQCPRWLRVQRRLDRQRWRQALADSTPDAGSGGWGGDASWPF
ncbi:MULTISPECIES: hypothetical protein [Streptomyces]|uniref:Phage protein n=1 Tax=Streptomyces caniscabiei TaxID=2746961 RepID=A0ABU4N247_9ACTN|nr:MULTISPECIES: hypothetical protein [Streptomyces]MBE4790289.1 hypothetical protein [Streptomyces caniscabiei]MBE4799482.1 hypothetical protein [Streptomyces caniscabiei]MDX3015146.1 hypothetical protein [Streptomyces caniscabiei]MDX3042589.1 hypothetical protein [Streptomyces caniscabiei]